MESRKRRLQTDPSTPYSNKKILLSSSSSSAARSPGPNATNGNGSDELMDVNDDLEAFRKEAIYRQMLEYRRLHQRSEEQLRRVAFERDGLEIRLTALDGAWKEFAQDVTTRLGSTFDPTQFESSAPGRSNNEVVVIQEVSRRRDQTKQLVDLVAVSAGWGQDSDQVRLMREQFAVLQQQASESSTARAQSDSRLRIAEAELDELRLALARAEKRVDRSRSKTVAKVEGRTLLSKDPPLPPKSPPQAKGSPSAVSDVASGKLKEEEDGQAGHLAVKEQDGEAPSGSKVGTNGDRQQDNGISEDLQSLSELRQRQLEEVRAQRSSLLLELDSLRLRLAAPAEELVLESTPFKHMQRDVELSRSDLESLKALLDDIVKEGNDLRERQEAFREGLLAEHNALQDDLLKKVQAKEADLTRVRGQREELKAEISELKAREAEKLKQLSEVRKLANSRQDRIEAYASEVRRFKMRLAANEGDVATVELLGEHSEPDAIKDLQARLKHAEELVLALRDQLKSYASNVGSGDAQSILRSETEARTASIRLQERLDQMEQLYGFKEGASNEERVQEIAARLKRTQEALKVAEAKFTAEEQSKNLLCGEIDHLSQAWQTLDAQSRDKVFNLVTLEEKVTKYAGEKAKADNRYFGAMRAKEALIGENAILTRLTNKQQSALESISEASKSTSGRLTAAEREITLYSNAVDRYKDQLRDAELLSEDVTNQIASLQRQLDEAQELIKQRTAHVEEAEQAKRLVEEQAIRFEAQAATAAAAATSKSSRLKSDESKEILDLRKYNADLTRMLKCSSCATRFKSHVLTRCNHLLCKECIDTRIETRQRKCPSCGLAFGVSDVQQVYF